jgi:hypothetical protein
MTSEEQVKRIKSQNAAYLLQRPGVSGIGVEKAENGDFVLAVHLDPAFPEASEAVDHRLQNCGCQVRKYFSGPFTKQ